jgi:hypothetical protein
MMDKRLEIIIRDLPDNEAIQTIISHHLDYGNSDGALVSAKQWPKIADCVIEWMNAKFSVVLTPEKWDRDMSDAWHKDLPDVKKAFANLREKIGI